MSRQKAILVTGSHRSGTTWVGKIIATSPSVGYIHEPFTLTGRPGICGPKFKYWFQYVTPENEVNFSERIEKTVFYSYNFESELEAVKSPKDILRMLRDSTTFFKYRIFRARPLLKDPMALFSAEWLSSKFDMDVIVMIRHPAAFVGSLKIKDWKFPFSHFLEQPLLMRDYLYPFADEVKDYASREHNIIDQGILLWRIIHYVIAKYQKDHKDWIFVRHEDLAKNPLCEFRSLYEKLDLDFSKKVEHYIQQNSTTPSKDASSSTNFNVYDIKRDSQEAIYTWKSRLTEAEIEKIRIKSEDIYKIFYSPEDW